MNLKGPWPGLLLILAAFVPTLAQVDGNNSDLELYKSYLEQSKSQSIERQLGEASTRLDEATKSNDPASKARALKELGLIHLTRTYDYGLAMERLIDALRIEDSLSLRSQQVITYLAIAKVYEEVDDNVKSEEFLGQALELNKKLNDPNILVLILNEMGKVKASSGKIDKAFEDYQQVLSLKDKLQKPDVEAEALFNLGHLYTLQGKYNEALDHHKQALSIRRSFDDKKYEALSLNDIGELYKLMGNSEKALANHVVALEIRRALQDQHALAESYNNIGVLYFQQKNFQRAAANLQLGLAAAQDCNDQHQLLRSYEYLSGCFEAAGNYKKALEYKNEFIAINDLIKGDENEHSLLETQNKYKIEQLDNERKQKEEELVVQKRFRNFLFVLVGLCVIIVVLVCYLYVAQQRSNKKLKIAHDQLNSQNLELQELNATKDKFFSIISHDLKGPLNSLTSFSSLLINHTESLSKEEIKMFASDFDKSLKNLFALLENLLEWSRSQTGNIEFIPESFDLAVMMEENKELLKAQAQNKNITLVNESPEKILIAAHRNSVNTVVRNLISNAIKFTPEGGKITLKTIRQNGAVVASITDTGVGMSENVIDKLFRIDSKHSTKGTANEKGTGLGLILCKEFVEKNGGKIWVSSKEGEGSVFSFSLNPPDNVN
ncbi:MAG TPA: tetratricopeptide repeat-containing sensor histidine kinase [Chryseolinea sp.]|nr:tetratricopeptide repeat-containing sensor histidine kinase [Chryseolinea sp.]